MSIRVATLDDLPRILDLGELLHKESPRWSRLTFNRDKAAAFMRMLLTSESGVVFVAERDGVVVGGIAGYAEAHWASDDVLANEVSFFMDPGARGSMAPTRLICALRAWGEIRGAKWLHAGTSTGLDPERTAGLYERLGFTRCAIGLKVEYGN
ncbi:GNAT superfamily N-acetyltransferase [Janthinobacterium sp. CG_23.3]|uniref:GNAT family N-acetyltransferase n=1 Tax=Janthinobacterium sp. CG_23.3 TaxID=3349634 RepID=UPI0038D39B89